MSHTDRLILGTVQLGMNYGINNKSGRPGKEESLEILEHARLNGITTLDTAEAYNDAQSIIGAYHNLHHYRFDIVTKLSEKFFDNTTTIGAHVKSNIEQLNSDHLEAYLFHNFAYYKTFSHKTELWSLKDQGLVRKIGVSIYTIEEAMELADCPDIDVVQLPFNLLDNSSQKERALVTLKDAGKEIHARSVMLQGLLLMNFQEFPEHLVPLQTYIARLAEIATSMGITIRELALAYVLNNPYIDKVLIGVDNLAHLDENIKAGKKQYDISGLAKVDRIHVKESGLLNPAKW